MVKGFKIAAPVSQTGFIMRPFYRLCNPKLQILGLSRPAGAVPLLLLGLALLALALPLVGQLLEPVGLRLLPGLFGLLLALLLGLLPLERLAGLLLAQLGQLLRLEHRPEVGHACGGGLLHLGRGLAVALALGRLKVARQVEDGGRYLPPLGASIWGKGGARRAT